MIEIGTVIADKYRVERVLGKGGMGYVVAAVHTQLGQTVAIKMMTPELFEEPRFIKRFLREARAAVRIRGEHVSRVLDVGTLDDGSPYTVMEYLEGHDLASELQDKNKLPPAVAVDYVLQVCEALAEAHSLGIVHRDLKPANLFLTTRPDGSALIKVLDFGISKAVTGDVESFSELPDTQTESHALLGSPHYMSPEQVRHPNSIDHRSDIWALGVLLHELLTGCRPFSGDTPVSLMAAIITDPVPALRERHPEVAPGLAQVIIKCLQKEPADRYSNVAELAEALEPMAPATSSAAISRIRSIVGRPAPTLATERDLTLKSLDVTPTSAGAPPVETPRALSSSSSNGSALSARMLKSRVSLVVALASGVALFGWMMYALGSSGKGDHASPSIEALKRESDETRKPQARKAPPPPKRPEKAAVDAATSDTRGAAADPAAPSAPRLIPSAPKAPAKPRARAKNVGTSGTAMTPVQKKLQGNPKRAKSPPPLATAVNPLDPLDGRH